MDELALVVKPALHREAMKTDCRWGSASKSRSFMYCENKRVRFREQDGQK